MMEEGGERLKELFEEYRRECLKKREAEQKGDEKRRKLEEVASEDIQA